MCGTFDEEVIEKDDRDCVEEVREGEGEGERADAAPSWRISLFNSRHAVKKKKCVGLELEQ